MMIMIINELLNVETKLLLLSVNISSTMSRVRDIFNRYPLLRGMVSYSLIWPTSAFVQQKIAGESWGEMKSFANANAM